MPQAPEDLRCPRDPAAHLAIPLSSPTRHGTTSSSFQAHGARCFVPLAWTAAPGAEQTGGGSAPVRRVRRAIASWPQLPLAAGFVVGDESWRRDHPGGRPAAGGVADAQSADGSDGCVLAAAALAFAGSALILAAIWRSLLNIAHADEHARASAPAAPSNGLPRPGPDAAGALASGEGLAYLTYELVRDA